MLVKTLIHSFNKHVLRAFSVLVLLECSENTVVGKIEIISALVELIF